MGIKNHKRSIKLKGGRFLGEGAFGCVVSPALQCAKSRTFRNISTRSGVSRRTKNNVSKIIINPDEEDDIKNEIKISSILRKIDPGSKHFLFIKENCRIKSIPKERSNLASVRYLDDNMSMTRYLENKKLDKNHCDVDLSLQPVNLIMPYGGFVLDDIINALNTNMTKLKKSNDMMMMKYKLGKSWFHNFKNCFYNLLEGLYKMHQHRIVNRDIKKENIIIDWNNEKHSPIIRYIDFGLSTILTNEYCKHISNIHLQGTYDFLPIELFIISKLKDYYNYGYGYSHGYDRKYILEKISKYIKKYVKQIFSELKLDSSNINNMFYKLFDEIEIHFKNRTLLETYFGSEDNKLNGYLQKADVYALGLSMYEIVKHLTDEIDLSKNIKLKDLLKNMMELDPAKRYNALECLKHPYFN